MQPSLPLVVSQTTLRAVRMLCIVKYSFLLVMICLRSSLLAATYLRVTELTGAWGKDITIECTTHKSPQHGVYMYRQERESKLKEIVYLYKDSTLTYKEINKYKINVKTAFPNLNVTIKNVTLSDAGLYWCEYNYEEKITLSKSTLLWIDTVPDPGTVCPRPECPDTYSYGIIIIILCAVVGLLCFFGFYYVIQKRCVGKEKLTPPNHSSPPVYEEMNRSNLSNTRSLINPDYQPICEL
ncbi:immunoglobulin V-set domain-containing protein [Danio aesculapii]|uniref:immunoglobulin V-set domain-containing protein n=1 Tax=Danio aesculapii TaxID=1142201 RepID=UPI0024C00FAE|nr:immunoglobulin V-set domain-containing protein [Danio aesculapii]